MRTRSPPILWNARSRQSWTVLRCPWLCQPAKWLPSYATINFSRRAISVLARRFPCGRQSLVIQIALQNDLRGYLIDIIARVARSFARFAQRAIGRDCAQPFIPRDHFTREDG